MSFLNLTKAPAPQQLARGFDKTREGLIRVVRQELGPLDDWLSPMTGDALHQLVEGIWAGDVDAIHEFLVSMCPRRYQHRRHLAAIAFAVVVAKVSRIGCCLI